MLVLKGATFGGLCLRTLSRVPAAEALRINRVFTVGRRLGPGALLCHWHTTDRQISHFSSLIRSEKKYRCSVSNSRLWRKVDESRGGFFDLRSEAVTVPDWRKKFPGMNVQFNPEIVGYWHCEMHNWPRTFRAYWPGISGPTGKRKLNWDGTVIPVLSFRQTQESWMTGSNNSESSLGNSPNIHLLLKKTRSHKDRTAAVPKGRCDLVCIKKRTRFMTLIIGYLHRNVIITAKWLFSPNDVTRLANLAHKPVIVSIATKSTIFLRSGLANFSSNGGRDELRQACLQTKPSIRDKTTDISPR